MFVQDASLALSEERSHEAWLLALASLARDIPDDRHLPTAVGLFANPQMANAGRLLWTSPVDHGVNRTAFSSDGRLLALAGRDHTIRLVEMDGGGPAGFLRGHINSVRLLAFQPGVGNDALIASCGEDPRVHLWRVPDSPWTFHRPARTLEHHTPVIDLAFSPGGQLATVTANGTFRIWNIKPGPGDLSEIGPDQTWQARPNRVGCLSFSNDGTLLGWGAGSHLFLRHRQTGQTTVFETTSGRVLDLIFINGQPVSIHQNGDMISWSPAGDRLWQVEADAARLAAFPDGRIVTMAYDGRLTLWNGHTGANPTVFASANSPDQERQERPDIAVNLARNLVAVTGESGLLWNLASGRKRAALSGHAGEIWKSAFSPDGRFLASAAQDRTIRLWRIIDNNTKIEEDRILRGHTSSVLNVAWSPDSQLLASASKDRTIKLWNLDPRAAESEVRTLTGHDGVVWDVAFSPDGQILASASADRTIKLWNIADGSDEQTPRETLVGHGRDVVGIAFSPDGQVLASASRDHTIRLWHVSGSNTGNRNFATLSDHTGEVWQAVFSPDGQTLVSASADKSIRLWKRDQGNGHPVFRLSSTLEGHGQEVWSVAISPDGRRLASASRDRKVMLWEATPGESGELLATLPGHTDEVLSVAFSPDGRTLASTSYDRTLKLWDVSWDRRKQHHSGHHATSVGQSTLSGHEGEVYAAALSPTGNMLASASGDQTVRLWSMAKDHSGTGLRAVLSGHENAVLGVAFSPQGDVLASASRDSTIRLWDLSDLSKPKVLSDHLNEVRGIAFSPDGQTLASASRDRTVILWDISQADPRIKATLMGHEDEVWSVAISPDGTMLASASRDQTVKLWQMIGTGTPLLATLSGHSGPVWSVAFSPDGRTLATASYDQTVRLWRFTPGDPMVYRMHATLSGHTGPIWNAIFSPDGRILATASTDDTVRLWDMTTLQPQATLLAHAGDPNWLAFAPDSRVLISSHDDHTLHLWDLEDLSAFNETSRDRAAWQELSQRALFYFGYRFDGSGLVPEQRFGLVPLDGQPFGKDHPYHHLTVPRDHRSQAHPTYRALIREPGKVRYLATPPNCLPIRTDMLSVGYE